MLWCSRKKHAFSMKDDVYPLEHQCNPFSHGLMLRNIEGITWVFIARSHLHYTSGPTATLHFEGQTVPHANPLSLNLETTVYIMRIHVHPSAKSFAQ